MPDSRKVERRAEALRLAASERARDAAEKRAVATQRSEGFLMAWQRRLIERWQRKPGATGLDAERIAAAQRKRDLKAAKRMKHAAGT